MTAQGLALALNAIADQEDPRDQASRQGADDRAEKMSCETEICTLGLVFLTHPGGGKHGKRVKMIPRRELGKSFPTRMPMRKIWP